MNIQSVLSGRKKYIIATMAYALIAIALFIPLIGNMRTTVIGNNADVYQNMWDIWWSGYSLLVAHVGIFSTTHLLFWPVGANLVFQTLSPISGLLSLPSQAFGLPFAYNLLFFLGFAITGLGGFILTEYITNNMYASAFGGLAFTFSSFHVAQEWGHMDFFNIGLTALFMYLFLRTIEEKKTHHALMAGAMLFLILFMDGIEEGLMVSLAALFILAFYLFSNDLKIKVLSRKLFIQFSEMVLFVILLSTFWLIPLVATAVTAGLSAANNLNTIQTNVFWSADVLSFFLPSYYNGIFHGMSSYYYNAIYGFGGPQDRIVYIGYVLLALAVYGAYKDKTRARLWLYMLVFSIILSLGPFLQIGAAILPIPLPYYILHLIPLLRVIREPGRFYLLASLCFAVLAGLGVKTLFEHITGDRATTRKVILLSVISVVFILESTGLPVLLPKTQFTVTPNVPTYIKNMSTLPGNFSVLSLPALPQRNDPALYMSVATYYTTALHKPLVGGYLTRTTSLNNRSLYSIPFVLAASNLDFSGNFTYVSPVNENYTLQSLKTLDDYGTRFIIVQNKAYNQSELRELVPYLKSVFGLPTYADSNITVFDTTQAIAAAHLYENGKFIAYPQPQSWYKLSPPYVPATGWTPLNRYGILAAYAPYINSVYNNSNSTSVEYVNTTIRFSVFSSLPEQRLSLLTYQNSPNGMLSAGVAYVNITSGQNVYTVNTTLIAGLEGNILAFVTGTLFDSNNLTRSVLINNITFSYQNSST